MLRVLSFGLGYFSQTLAVLKVPVMSTYVPTVLNPETSSLKGLKEEGWSTQAGPVSTEPRLDTMNTEPRLDTMSTGM